MINVVIADHDEENRNNFRTFIKTTRKDFSVVRAIEHGKDPIKVIEESNAQLLIADVRFFGASSIAVINKIHSNFPTLLLLLYGSFNDYDYLEKAAETGVVTYMYKPVKTAELGKNLDKILSLIKMREEENQ